MGSSRPPSLLLTSSVELGPRNEMFSEGTGAGPNSMRSIQSGTSRLGSGVPDSDDAPTDDSTGPPPSSDHRRSAHVQFHKAANAIVPGTPDISRHSARSGSSDGGNYVNFDWLATGRDEEWVVDPEEVNMKKKIGEGSFCDVHVCTWRSSTVVAKMVRQDAKSTARGQQDIVSEIQILRKLRHPHIIRFLGVTQWVRQQPVLLLEHVEGQTLQNWVRNKHPSLHNRCRAMAELALALVYCHASQPRIIYRDLKPDNIMVDIHGRCTLLDFGLSRHIPAGGLDDVYAMTGCTGTQRFMAPEVARNQKYGTSADVFSFGMVMCVCFTGDLPFGGHNGRDRLDRFRSGDMRALDVLNSIRPAGACRLVERCVSVLAAERPTMQECHKVLQELQRSSATSVGSACGCSIQ